MLKLEVLEDSRHQSGDTTFLSINPSSIVTMRPIKNGIWEYRQPSGPKQILVILGIPMKY